MAHSYENYCNDHQKNVVTQENLKYMKKYRKLKQLVKNLVFENAALCDQVAQTQENLVTVKDERLYLLRKMCQLQGESDPAVIAAKIQNNNSSIMINSDGSVTKKPVRKRNPPDNPKVTGDGVGKPKPKRASKNTKKIVQLIPLDIQGRPVFPISLGDLTIYSLGEVVSDRVAYHTEDFIYPVGFCSTRVYANLKDPQLKSLYTCKILDGGAKPRFEIISDNDMDQPIVGASPDDCHARLLASISPLLSNIMPRGASFFGISHPTIQNLIQSSPGTRKLVLYKTQRFEVCKNPIETGYTHVPEDQDPSINFNTLHRTLILNAAYRIKEEPIEHNLCVAQNLS